MAAPAFGAAGTYLVGAALDNAAVAVPAGVTAGQIVEVYLYLENGGNAVTPPDGTWTEVASAGSVAAGHWFRKFWKRATAADSGTYTFTWTGPTAWREGVAVRYTGATSSGSPYAGAHSTALDSTATDGITPAVSVSFGVEYLATWAGTNGNGGVWTPPSSFVERVDNSTNLSVATLAFNNGGSTGSVTGTCASAGPGAGILGAMVGPSESAPPPRRRSPSMAGPWMVPQPRKIGTEQAVATTPAKTAEADGTASGTSSGSHLAPRSTVAGGTASARTAGAKLGSSSASVGGTASATATAQRVLPSKSAVEQGTASGTTTEVHLGSRAATEAGTASGTAGRTRLAARTATEAGTAAGQATGQHRGARATTAQGGAFGTVASKKLASSSMVESGIASGSSSKSHLSGRSSVAAGTVSGRASTSPITPSKTVVSQAIASGYATAKKLVGRASVAQGSGGASAARVKIGSRSATSSATGSATASRAKKALTFLVESAVGSAVSSGFKRALRSTTESGAASGTSAFTATSRDITIQVRLLRTSVRRAPGTVSGVRIIVEREPAIPEKVLTAKLIPRLRVQLMRDDG